MKSWTLKSGLLAIVFGVKLQFAGAYSVFFHHKTNLSQRSGRQKQCDVRAQKILGFLRRISAVKN
jgi:hypothetical protein